MKCTLIAFHWGPEEYGSGGATQMERAAKDNPGVEIDKGIYLYRTAQDALYVRRLSEVLRGRKMPFLEIHFESETCELSGYLTADAARQLKTILRIEAGNLIDLND